MSMMVIMDLSPVFIWNETKKTTNESYGVVNLLGLKKGLMSAIMLDDENPYQKEGIDKSEADGDPDRPIETKIH